MSDIFSLISMETMIGKGRKCVEKRRELMKKDGKDQERGDQRQRAEDWLSWMTYVTALIYLL